MCDEKQRNQVHCSQQPQEYGASMPATSVIVGAFGMGLGLGGFLTPLRVLSFAVLVGGEPMDGHPRLVPASPSIEATAANQKHDNDND
jgi:hypothetical protein